MPQKINWKLLWQKSIFLCTHTLLAGFYLKLAQILFDYYRMPLLAAFAFTASISFALPLLMNLLDHWSCVVEAVREDALAEKMLKVSIAIHKKLFGSKNTFMAAKQAMLASLYFDIGKSEQAEVLFKEAWNISSKSLIKFPLLVDAAFADYVTILNSNGDTAGATEVQRLLKYSQRLRLVQKLASSLFTVPIVCFLYNTQAAEHSIAKHNAHGQVLQALKEMTTLARIQTFVLGEYAAAKLYSEYAVAFDDTNGQLDEMDWCTDKALESLQRSGKLDEYLQVLLLNLKAKSYLAERKTTEGRKCLEKAVSLSLNWSKAQLSQSRYEAQIERDKAILALAELDRNSGRYIQAEVLYKKVLDGAGGQTPKGTLLNTLETVDSLHKLQHIELKLGKKNDALKLQEEVCNILENCVKGLIDNSRGAAVCDFGVREASREMNDCAIMLEESGRNSEAKEYQSRAANLRKAHNKSLKLDAEQRDSIVDATTKVTNDLLSVKYRAGNWQQSLSHLLNDELKSKKARGAFERLPWYDANNIKTLSNERSDRTEKTLKVDIAPLSIRSNREGDGIAVDVQGTVKIFNSKSKSEDEQQFGFAYVLKAENSGQQSVEDLMDNQALAHIRLD